VYRRLLPRRQKTQVTMKNLSVAVIVIPTYNEAKNIGRMIEYLNTKTFPALKNKWNLKILVVDGNSPDGTAKIVKKLSQKYPQTTHLFLETSKDGLGAAYLKGFKYAMEKLKADAVFEFDADFQHPPEMIAPMLKEIEKGYDYVLGSRKVKGGSNPKGWGLKRVFFSEAGGLTARILLFFPFKNFFKVTDPTTGLKVTRVKGFLDHLDLSFSHLHTKGFAYKMQLLFETLKLGAKYKEVPLSFQVRTEGVSKIDGNAVMDGIKVCFLTRWSDDVTQKFLKFGTVGFIGYLVNAIGLSLFFGLTGVEWLAWLLSTEIAIISNFTWNNLWTFKGDKIKGVGLLVKKFFQFNFTSLGALLIQTIAGTLLVYLTHFNRQILLPFIVLFLILPYNWMMYNTFIWKKKKI
jgi:dolichol-phosphate mannosyltransferase